MCPNHPFVQVLLAVVLVYTHTAVNAANIPISTSAPEVESDVRVDCNNDEIVVSISTRSGRFNGMIYPAGLTKSSPCFGEWIHTSAPVKYKLPLRACNTMSMELDDGGVEYFNTIVVQPHLKLVTNQGRSFHIRCKYNSRNNTVTVNDIGPKIDFLHSEDAMIAPMPGCTMKIFTGDPNKKEVAENVKIGDPLSLQISLDEQETYGIRVADCLVRDGIGSGEQKLINNDGCPLDSEIMGMFQYSEDKTNAIVKFQAHKFPSTESVYYQCNVKLCLKANGGCVEANPVTCGSNRVRRQANSVVDTGEGTPATIEVYSGLYVNEANEPAKVDDDSVVSERAPEDSICISQKNFAIGICVAGLILMFCAITAILCLLARRRTKKVSSNPSSSIYSGPYTNTAYSHSS